MTERPAAAADDPERCITVADGMERRTGANDDVAGRAILEIRRSLPDGHRAAAARIFDEAFGDDLSLVVPSRERRLDFLARAFKAHHIVAALEGDELVGMAGLSSADDRYPGGAMIGGHEVWSMRDILGRAGTIRAALGLALTDHRPMPGELYLDGIAVASRARGRGIGTMLLDEVARLARDGGFERVRLEVIDTNLRAQQLYRRHDFRVIRVQRFGLLRPLLGYGGVISMELAIQASRRDG